MARPARMGGVAGVAVVAAFLLGAPGAMAAPPPNDDFANAQDLGQQLNWEIDGTTTDATLQDGEDGWYGSPTSGGGSVWYRWTAPRDMRFWIDNCDAASATGISVYRGSALAALTQLDPYVVQPPYCEGNGLYGARDEYRVRAGVTYSVRVSNKLYDDGAFHLRFRYIVFDGSLGQSASRKTVKKGGTVTYTDVIRNLGTIPFTTDLDLVTTKPGRLAQAVPKTRYVSIKTTFGKCRRQTYFVEHRGALCTFTDVPPGTKIVVTSVVRPSQSLTHWAFLDYALGGDRVIVDDNPKNDPDRRTNTVVKPSR